MNGERTRRFDDNDNRKHIISRPRSLNLWRPSSLVNLVSPSRRNRVLHSYLTTDSSLNNGESPSAPEEQPKNGWLNLKDTSKKEWDTIVTVVVVEAKGLPNPPSDGSAVHNIYCKIRLGSESLKSKTVQSSQHVEWRERLNLHLKKDNLLRVSLWDKGKQKNFMGSCVIDMTSLEKERTHEIWQPLDDGFGAIHLNITMCAIRRKVDSPYYGRGQNTVKEKISLLDFNDWETVGQLHVTVIGARGLSGKPNAYCVLTLDNARVQTHCSAKKTSDPVWKKKYVFDVHDVTSVLEVKVHDSSLVYSLGMDYLGKVSIPLLRIRNGEARWYALKDRNKRNSAKGNCPRIQLEMSLVWNPVKASLRLFRPAEVKYVKKPAKFDISLVYSNLIFIKDTLNFLVELNEGIKQLFEWDNRELSTIALLAWLVFWYYIRLWSAPLLLLIPFVYYWFNRRNQCEIFLRRYSYVDIDSKINDTEKIETSLTSKVVGLPEVTLIITNGIEYLASIAERFYNLASFKVPFLSYLTMILLIGASVILYLIPFNYLMMALGMYKYTRKYLDPERKLNNDLLDFISRIPDNEILKDWEELGVPEPHVRSNSMRARSNSS